MIKVEHLSKRYGALEVLRDINVEIAQGEVISIIGPSGTGKSTFLRCLNLLDIPSGGRIEIDGQDILAAGARVPELRRRMGMVFQSFNLFPHLTVLENLTIGPIRLLRRPRAEAEAAGLDLLRQVGLAEKAHSLPEELSGGQQQRVAIARCLSMTPEIILFDEPTSALDPTMVSEVLAVIRRLARQGMTMAIVTHEMEFARDVSTRVLYMDEGVIYEQGPPAELFDAPRRERTRDFIGKVRSLSVQVCSADFDLYAIFGQIERFGEKHLLPVRAVRTAQLLVEELLAILVARPGPVDIGLVMAYSEKRQTVELRLDCAGEAGNPLDPDGLPDGLGLALIETYARDIAYAREGDRNRLTMQLMMGQRPSFVPNDLPGGCLPHSQAEPGEEQEIESYEFETR
jgi:polar amino acid transport system ATP-binding protein